jgi:uncharacterized protein
MIEKRLINRILGDYKLAIDGIHGITHWARVLETGLKLCSINGADPDVVSLFAVLHDSKRINDNRDRAHGPNAALFLNIIRDEYLDLNDKQFQLLYDACYYHTRGCKKGDITVQTCWDSDRLDLGRIGIVPEKNRLCTEAAGKSGIFDWANRNAEEMHVPAFIKDEWGIDVYERI